MEKKSMVDSETISTGAPSDDQWSDQGVGMEGEAIFATPGQSLTQNRSKSKNLDGRDEIRGKK